MGPQSGSDLPPTIHSTPPRATQHDPLSTSTAVAELVVLRRVWRYGHMCESVAADPSSRRCGVASHLQTSNAFQQFLLGSRRVQLPSDQGLFAVALISSSFNRPPYDLQWMSPCDLLGLWRPVIEIRAAEECSGRSWCDRWTKVWHACRAFSRP